MILNYHVQPIQIKEPSVRLPMRYSEGLASAAKNIPLTVLTTKQKHVLVSIRSKHELESILKTDLFSFVGTNLA